MFYASKMKSMVAAFAVAGAVAVAPAGAAELKFASFTGPSSTVTPGVVDVLTKALDEGTKGGTTLGYYPGGQLGAGPLEQYIRVVQGVADLAWGLPGYTSTQFPRTMLSELPGAITEPGHGYDLIWNAWDKGLLTQEFPGTKPIALWMSEPNIIIMKDHQIRTPADLKGLKIRVAGAVAGDMLSALGATPVQMPATEVYNALQTGLIDGIVTGASAVSDFKYLEVANSYTTNVPLGSISFFTVMNQSVYDNLPADAKAAIDSVAGRKISQNAEETWNGRATKVIADLKADPKNTVIELTDAERKAFDDLVMPIAEKVIANTDGGEEVFKAMHGM